jgi:hypothetical protein
VLATSSDRVETGRKIFYSLQELIKKTCCLPKSIGVGDTAKNSNPSLNNRLPVLG